MLFLYRCATKNIYLFCYSKTWFCTVHMIMYSMVTYSNFQRNFKEWRKLIHNCYNTVFISFFYTSVYFKFWCKILWWEVIPNISQHMVFDFVFSDAAITIQYLGILCFVSSLEKHSKIKILLIDIQLYILKNIYSHKFSITHIYVSVQEMYIKIVFTFFITQSVMLHVMYNKYLQPKCTITVSVYCLVLFTYPSVFISTVTHNSLFNSCKCTCIKIFLGAFLNSKLSPSPQPT